MSPAPEQTRQPRRPARRAVSPIWFGVGLFALLLLINGLSATLGGGQTLQYSEFKSLVKQNVVTEVLVGLETLNPIGLTGALCVWLSAALSLAARSGWAKATWRATGQRPTSWRWCA